MKASTWITVSLVLIAAQIHGENYYMNIMHTAQLKIVKVVSY